MEENNKISAEQLIDSINAEYYANELENLKNAKIRLKYSRGTYNGKEIKKMSKQEKENQLKHVERQIEILSKKYKDMKEVEKNLQDSKNKTQKLTEEQELTYYLDSLLRHNREYSKQEQKAFIKTTNPILSQTQKIDKEMYKLLKENSKLNINYISSISYQFDKNNYQMEYIFRDLRSQESQLARGKVDNQRIIKAVQDRTKEPTEYQLYDLLIDKELITTYYELKNFISKNYNINPKEKEQIENFLSKYSNIVELAKDIRYLDELIDIFKDTEAKKSELYQSMKETREQEEKNLYDQERTTTKQYENSGIKKKIDAASEMRKLQNQLDLLKQQMKETNSEEKRFELQMQASELNNSLNSLLQDYPELNKNRLNIDKEKTEQLREQLKSEYDQKQQEEKKKQLREQLKSEYTEHKQQTNNQIEIKNIELEENLQIQRTQFYQQYLIEKVKNTDLGKMSFSEYLKTTKPNSRELIEIEQSRENMANIIYNEYLKYYELLDDKTTAMSFEQFAYNKYGVENVDIPLSYEENYKEIRKK